MKAPTGRLLAVAGMAAFMAGFAVLFYGITERSEGSADMLMASSMAVGKLRDLDEVERELLRDPSGKTARKKLLRSMLEAFESEEKEALERSVACLDDVKCRPGLEAMLDPVQKVYEARLDRQYGVARGRRSEGDMMTWIGLISCFVSALFLAGMFTKLAGSVEELEDRGAGPNPKMEELLRDRLTKLYAVREKASESEHFAAYGEIAAGLSHGLKTPLSSVRAACQVAQRKLEPDHPAMRHLEEIISEVDTLVEQIQRFLQAAGPNRESKGKHIDPHVILEQLGEAYAGDAKGRGVDWQTTAPDDIGGVIVDPGMLEIALRNLVENALAVAPGGSTVSVEARPCDAPARAGIDSEPPPEGKSWIEIAIRDEGPGIPSKIVDGGPGLSTKSSGSGLGMAIAKRIVARQGGALLIDTEEGQGTTIRIVVPEADETREAEQ